MGGQAKRYVKWTARSIEALRPDDRRFIAWRRDGGGLGVRVSPEGRKTFVYMYRFGGLSRMMTLGVFPRLSLAGANEAHARAQTLLEAGRDPGAEHVAKRKEAREADTVAELVKKYVEYAQVNKKTWREDERQLEKDVIPALGKKKARDVSRKDVIALLDDVKARGAPISANRLLAILTRMYHWGVSRDLVPGTPIVAIERPSKEQQRERVLSEPELRDVLRGLHDLPALPRLATRLLLLTASRRGETVNATWSEFDRESGWWTIPAERSKNGLSHRVPLVPETLALLEELRALNPKSEFLFPGRGGKRPMSGDGLGRILREHFAGMESWVVHDIRRSVASHIAGMGVSRLTISKLLNHTEAGITRIYDRHSYDAEKRAALEAWARRLDEIEQGQRKGATVLPLNRQA